MELSQEALQTRVDATANEVRAFARGYASAVEAHCLSLLRRLEELRVQRRYDATECDDVLKKSAKTRTCFFYQT